jgi:hypothetical protein
MTYIEGVNDPMRMWQILEERYNPKTQTTLLQTLREFMTTMESGVNMEQHLQRVQRLKRQVEALRKIEMYQYGLKNVL